MGDSGKKYKVNGDLPIARVRKIMRQDPAVGNITGEAVVVAAAAAELFLAYMVEVGVDALTFDGRARKTIQYDDLVAAVQERVELEFLEDVVTPRTTLKELEDADPDEIARAAAPDTLVSGQRSILAFAQKK